MSTDALPTGETNDRGIAEEPAFADTPDTPSVSADAPDAPGARDALAAIAQRPRIRWAAILWGGFFVAIAAAGIWLCLYPPSAAEILAFSRTVGTAEAVGAVIIAFGIVVVITGLVVVIRRHQRAAASRHVPNE